MAKVKTVYTCSSCGAHTPKWLGKCPSCNEWNTFVEERLSKNKSSRLPSTVALSAVPVKVNELAEDTGQRMSFPEDPEMNRVLGGGLVAGAVVLIGGQPGIGKSTLMLQLAGQLPHPVLYVSGEESPEQIALRSRRIEVHTENLYILAETDVDKILRQAEKIQPALIIVDSIQTLYSAELESTPGTVSQIRASAADLQRYAKATGIPVCVIGHITKDGTLAGPKVLEHMVDVVLHFEGDRNYVYRLLRTVKNRFGSTDELGIYEMKAAGLEPISNPGELLLSQSREPTSGSAVAATVEGVRPLLIETQALVSNAVYGNPQRNTTGFDPRRLGMLLAVLEKKCGLFYSSQDVYLNIAGGLRLTDPAADLAIAAALTSSLHDIPVDRDICFCGEISLSGEIRAVSRADQRIREAERMGFAQIIVSKYNQLSIQPTGQEIQIVRVQHLDEMIKMLFT